MECPKCGSTDNVITLEYDRSAEDPEEKFKQSYPFLFEYEKVNNESTHKEETLILLLMIFSGVISFVSLMSIFSKPLMGFVLIPSALTFYLSYSYYFGEKIIRQGTEQTHILKLKDRYYCEKDDVVFKGDRIIDTRRNQELKKELSDFFRDKKPFYKKLSVYGTIATISSFIIILGAGNLTESGSPVDNKEEGVYENEFGHKILGNLNTATKKLPGALEDINKNTVEGRYYGHTYTIGALNIRLVKWDRLENTKVFPDKIYRDNKRYDGIIYFFPTWPGGGMGLVGVWRLTNEYVKYDVPTANPNKFTERKDIRLLDVKLFRDRKEMEDWEEHLDFSDDNVLGEGWELGFMETKDHGTRLLFAKPPGPHAKHTFIKREDITDRYIIYREYHQKYK